jgi:hypothetical protein
MKFSMLFTVAAFGASLTCSAQQATVKQYTTPLSGQVELSKVEDKYNAAVYNLEMPEPDAEGGQKELRAVKQKIAEQFPRKRSLTLNKATAIAPPVLAFSYVADTSPGIPPDNSLAVSKANVSIAMMNTSVAVHNATTGQMVIPKKSLKGFSNSVGLPNSFNISRYDPKVIYDADADRFISVLLHETDGGNWIIVGFSATNNPGGLWHFYKFYGNLTNDTTWFDYPSIAITQKEFFLTGNKVRFGESWQEGFKESVIFQINKQQGYDGDTAVTYNLWQNVAYNGKNIRNLYPVKAGSFVGGPEQFFLSNRNYDVQNDTVFLVKVPDTIGGNTNLTVTPLVSNIPYGVPPNGRQPDTSVVLATNDGRVLGAFAEGNEIQFVSTTVNPATGGSAVYHGKISNYKTAPTLQANIYGVDTLDFGYPNLSYAGNNGADKASIISFDYTGPHTYPGFAAILYDGSQYSDMTYIKTGSNYILQLNDTVQRWGDYSGSQPDYNSFGTVWAVGIYGRNDKEYGNYVGKLVSPFVNSIKTTPAATNNSVVYPNPASEVIKISFDLTTEADLTFSIFDITGRKVDEILKERCEEGRNRIQFDIATLAPGTYFLNAVSRDGKIAFSKRFIKQ